MLRYVKLVVGSLLVGATFFFACRSKEIVPLPADHIVLTVGQSTLTSAGVTVTADTVNVSICPANASCFAPDNVSASIRLSRETEVRRVRLFAGFSDLKRATTYRSNDALDSTAVTLGGQLYKVILKGQYLDNVGQNRNGRAILQVSRL